MFSEINKILSHRILIVNIKHIDSSSNLVVKMIYLDDWEYLFRE